MLKHVGRNRFQGLELLDRQVDQAFGFGGRFRRGLCLLGGGGRGPLPRGRLWRLGAAQTFQQAVRDRKSSPEEAATRVLVRL